MKTITKVRVIFATLSVVLVSVIASFAILNKPTYATADSLGKKWFLADHYNCILWSASEEISGSVDTRDSWSTIEELMYTKGNYNATQPTPNYKYLGTDIDFLCRDVLSGTSGMIGYSGVLKNIMLEPKAGLDQVSESQMKSLGYNPKDSDVIMISKQAWSSDHIIPIKLEDPGYIKVTSGPDNTLSYSVTEEGDLGLSLTDNILTGNKQLEIRYKFSGGDVTGHDLTVPAFSLVKWTCSNNNEDGSIPVGLPPSGSVDDAIRAINTKIDSIRTRVEFCFRSDVWGIFDESHTETHEVFEGLKAEVSNSAGYSLGNRKSAADQSINRLLGNGSTANLKPEEDEYYDLYYFYLKNAIFDGKNDPLSNGSLSCTGGSGYTEIHLKAGDGKYHRYYINNSKKDQVTDRFKNLTLNGDGTPVFSDITIDDIIGWFREFHPVEVEDPEGNCPAPAGTEEKKEADEDPCYKNSGALGWIVCPVMDYAGKAVGYLYKNIIEPLLQIDVNAFNQGSPTYSAWQTFQSIANIIFVILFLVVIFSQVTGVGIDNLGIKRIMPKLIVTAILVNVSYILCMLLVDVSNIAGFGIYRFFDSLSTTEGVVVNSAQGTLITDFVAGTGITGGAITGGVGVVAIVLNPSLILPLLLGLIGLLISVLFMFVLLGVYQAGVVIAVILSPIAFVLYMLPNTKNIFDRWRKLFQALLLLYPICGLMIGGGAFAGRIISNTSPDFFVKLAGALLAVVPFFFIPKILQSSLSAMGNIGAKISGIGKGASSKATGAIANSQAVKDWQTRGKAGYRLSGKRTIGGRIREGFGKNDTISKIPVLRSMQKSSNRKMSRAEASYQKMVDEQDMKPETIRNAAEAERYRKDVSAFDSYLVKEGIADNIGAMNADGDFEEGSLAYELEHATDEYQRAAITSRLMSTKPGQEALYQVVNKMSKKGGDTNAIKQIARTAKNDKKFGDLKDKNLSMADYFNNLGRNGLATGAQFKEGESLNDFIGNTDFGNLKPEDVTKLSAKELNRYVRAIEDGSFSKDKSDQLKSIVQQTVDSEMLRDKIGDDAGKEMRSILNAGYGSAKNGRATATGSGSTGSKISGASGGSVNSGNAVEGESFQVNSEKPANKTTSSEK